MLPCKVKFKSIVNTPLQITVQNIINDRLIQYKQFKMMNFIMKPQLLPFTKTMNVHHFYEFQAKQIKQKQLEEVNKLDHFLKKIEEQQLRQKKLKGQAVKLNRSVGQKCNEPPQNYCNDWDTDKMAKFRPSSTKSHNNFYEKNKRWKENVEAQILKRKNQKIQQQEKQFMQNRKPLSQKQSMLSNYTFKQTTSFQHAFESKGPISGWTQRFHDYIKKRLPQESMEEFKPKINKKSQIIASKMVGKVEDRLIKYGQIMKVRKHETMISEMQKIGKLPNSRNHLVSTGSDQSYFFYRLYKQAETTNRKIIQKLQQSQFSFRPKITKLPEKLQKRVQEKRQKSPLYSLKRMSKHQTQRYLQLYTRQTGRQYNQADFQSFIKRNQLLLERKQKNMAQKQRQDLQKQEKILQQCTFIPLLNSKSMRILQKKQEQRVAQQEDQYVYSDDQVQLQVSPSPLFSKRDPNQTLSKQIKPNEHGKYEYICSYNQRSDFDYQLRTPATQKHKMQGSSFMKSQIQSAKLNDVSEMDSLQFSGQNNRLYSMQKQTESRNQNILHSSRTGQSQIINYQLTFSNRKLQDELRSANREEIYHNQHQHQHQPIHQIASNQINNQQKNKLTQTNWESELDQVKNRLQKLMKNNTKIITKKQM